MIGRLVGHVVSQGTDHGDDGTIVVDVQGVGYEVTVPLGTVGRAEHDASDRVTLHIHTVVREDAFLLYGLASIEERAAFRTLLSIPNVGPKLAISILSALSVAELADAIVNKQVMRLTAISGVGKKTAERLVLELKDKLWMQGLAIAAKPAPKQTVLPTNSGKADLLRGALAHMGFRPHEVERGIDAVRPQIASAELADLVREALGVLGT